MQEVAYLGFPVAAALLLALSSTQDAWQRSRLLGGFVAAVLLAALPLSLVWLSTLEGFAALWLSPFHQSLELVANPAPLRAALGLSFAGSENFMFAFLVSGAVTAVVFVYLLLTKPASILRPALLALSLILGAGFLFVTTESLPLMFFSFELLLLTSLYLLRLTSKSERVLEASTEMFFWTLLGSLALLTLFAWVYAQGGLSLGHAPLVSGLSTAQLLLLFVGFGVKVPVWPFFSWLLKAHVEASVEFSILLSGFIVKVGVCGLFKLLQFSSSAFATQALAGACIVGLVVATTQLFGQRDLKRLVALTTVIEMNWLGLCLALGGVAFEAVAAYLVAVHSLTTALEFLVVEVISKRYGTRDLTQLSGLWHGAPLAGAVAFLVTLVTIGFPGTPLFTAKVLFFVSLAPLSVGTTLVVGALLLLVTPLLFMRVWAPVWFGLPPQTGGVVDLSGAELLMFACLIVAATALALHPAFLVCL